MDTYSRFVYFETKDIHSGVDYFELSVRETGEALSQQPFFTEAVSPFKIPYEKPGRYSVVVRAFDKAGNWREGEVKFRLINPTFAPGGAFLFAILLLGFFPLPEPNG